MRAALLAVALAGCTSSDPCFGHGGTCIGVHLEGAGSVTQLDQVRVEVRVPGTEPAVFRLDDPSPAGSLRSLPSTAAVYLDSTVLGDALVSVAGVANAEVLDTAEASLHVDSGKHYQVTAMLGAPRDGGALACPSGALLCDDFEKDGMPTSSMWPAWFGGAPMMGAPTDNAFGLDDGEVYRGKYAALASASGGNGGTAGLVFAPPATTSGTVALRAYVYMSAPLANVTELFDVRDGSSSGILQVGVGARTTGDVGAGYWTLSAPNATPPIALPTGVVADSKRWLCVELVVDLDTRVTSLYATDAFVPDRAAAPIATVTNALAGVAELDLGFVGAPGAVTQSTWFDDVAIATSRIGCE